VKRQEQSRACDHVVAETRGWVETVVVGLNLCPFAKRELLRNAVRFAVSPATTERELLHALADELAHLETDTSTETTLLIHPQVLGDFGDYNDFLGDAEALLVDAGLEGVYQIASFHPDYQFAGTEPADAENYSNRSPYPLLHLLREASVARAVESHPDVDAIPERNIALMREMGAGALQALLVRQ